MKSTFDFSSGPRGGAGDGEGEAGEKRERVNPSGIRRTGTKRSPEGGADRVNASDD